MTRLYLPVVLAAGDTLALPAEAAHHVARVLRLKQGASLTVFNGQGGEYRAVLETVDKAEAVIRVGAHDTVERESALDLTLAQCVSKGERMDYCLQKAVELGVRRIVPLQSARSVVKLDAQRWRKKHAHWRGVIVSACQQSGRNRLPVLEPVQSLSSWLEADDASDPVLRLVLAPGAQCGLRSLSRDDSITLLVGPEGGLATDEIRLAQRQGYQSIALGPRVLRTETAGVAALAALQTLWGDLA